MSAIRELDVVRLRGWQVGTVEPDGIPGRTVYPGTIGAVVHLGERWAIVEVVFPGAYESLMFEARLTELEPVWRLGVGPLVPTYEEGS